jgi:hypothetical protein
MLKLVTRVDFGGKRLNKNTAESIVLPQKMIVKLRPFPRDIYDFSKHLAFIVFPPKGNKYAAFTSTS